ncbi:MAG: DUF3253 domain-containing protein, partial [Myxococcota bacterium]
RTIEWRKKWERDWEQVKYCSSACRRRKPGAHDRALEEAIERLLEQRGHGKTICPSEAVRAVFTDDEWRAHMEDGRRAARRLVAEGRLEITQGGKVVDPSTAKGPIRLRRPR